MARRLFKVCVVLCVTLPLSGCAWLWKEPLTGAYGDGYRSGCDAREHGYGYEARDADRRARFQERYWAGWGRGFNSCISPWEKERQEKFLNGDKKKYCTKHQKKRGHCED